MQSMALQRAPVPVRSKGRVVDVNVVAWLQHRVGRRKTQHEADDATITLHNTHPWSFSSATNYGCAAEPSAGTRRCSTNHQSATSGEALLVPAVVAADRVGLSLQASTTNFTRQGAPSHNDKHLGNHASKLARVQHAARPLITRVYRTSHCTVLRCRSVIDPLQLC